MMLEDEVQALIRLEAPRQGIVLMRNNSGAFTDSSGRVIRFGLGNESKKVGEHFKSSDLIGITPVLVTPNMVGFTLGVFTAIECKKEGWNPKNLNARETAQKAFIDFVRSKNGIAGFANSVDAFKIIIGKG